MIIKDGLPATLQRMRLCRAIQEDLTGTGVDMRVGNSLYILNMGGGERNDESATGRGEDRGINDTMAVGMVCGGLRKGVGSALWACF